MSKGHSFQIGFQVRDGQFLIEPGAISREVKTWPDCEGVLTLEQDEAQRSSAANRYLFGVVYREIHNETGQSKKDIHDEMKARFTTETISRIDPRTGRIVEFEVVRGTRGMKVTRFHQFVKDVKLFASEFFGITFDDEPEDVQREYEQAVAREKKREKVPA